MTRTPPRLFFVAFALFGGAAPGTAYRPARLIDGKIVPGQLGKRHG